MGKNNTFINAMRNITKTAKHEVVNVTPAIYASIALALHREYGFGYKRVNKVFKASQDIWENHSDDIIGMIELCEQETNIRLQGGR